MDAPRRSNSGALVVIGIALLILTGVGPLIPWRKASGEQLLRRFAASGNDDTRPMHRSAGTCFHGSSQMHRKRHRADNSIGKMHQANELTQRRLADEVLHAFQWQMPMPRFPTLDERNPSLEVIDHTLVACRVPPLGSEVVLPASDNDPELFRWGMSV